MKKITTKDKSKARNILILSILLVGIMVISTVGFALNFGGGNKNSKDIVDYNGVKFFRDSENSGYWRFNYQNYDFIMQYNPQEVSDIKFFTTLSVQSYAGKPLYFSGDSGEPVYEIVRNLGERFIPRTQKACISEKECKEDLPVKNCSDDNIIILKEPEENQSEGIYQEENCIFIIAKYSNQTRFADRFLFGILKI